MNHDIKCWPRQFHAIRAGRKRHELRRNDRNFAIGDNLTLREYLPEVNRFTGDLLMVVVTNITTATEGIPGLEPGFVVMSITMPLLEREVVRNPRRAPQDAQEPGWELRPGQGRVVDITPVKIVVDNHHGERRSLRPEGVYHIGQIIDLP